MRKLVLSINLVLILIVPTCTSLAQGTRVYVIDDFKKGLNIRESSIDLEKRETPDCQNVLFDETGKTIYSRKGYSQLGTLPVSGTIYLIDEFKRQSGKTWIMVHIATSVYASDDDCVSWTKVIEGLSEVYGGNSVTYNDEWYFTNGVDDVFSWNTSTTSIYGYIPQGKYIEVHNDQLFVANVPENYSAIFWCSGVYSVKSVDGWRYDNGFIVSENKGDTITGIKSEGAVLVVYLQNSIWYISGDGSSYNFPVKYTDTYGCSTQKSINNCKNSRVFLSKQGLCSYANGSIQQIDRRIDDLTRNALVTVGTIIGKQWTQTTENDFRLGTASNVVVNNGTIRTLSAETVNDINDEHKYWNTEIGYLPNEGGVDGTDYQLQAVTYVQLPAAISNAGHSVSNIALNLKRTSSDVFISSVTVKILDLEGTILAQDTKYITDLGNGDWYNFFSTFTVIVSESFEVQAFRTHDTRIGFGGLEYQVWKPYKYYASGERAGEQYADVTSDDGIIYEYKTLNKSFSAYTAEFQANMKVQGWEEVGKDYYNWGYRLEYRRKLRAGDRVKLSLKYDYSLNPSTWGFLTSEKFNAGTSINTWKHFLTGDSGDNITYQIKYATGSTALDSAAWNSISNGDLISATTSQHWVQWKATLNDEYQRVDSVMLRWFEINDANYQDAHSVFFNNRYHLFYSTYGYTNNLVIIYDYNENFTKWDIQSEAAAEYNNQLIFGLNNTLYKLYDTWNDDGSAINYYWESKDIDFDTPDHDKIIEKIGITAKGSGTLGLKWKSNYDTSYTTASITLSSSWNNEVIAVPNDSPIKYIRMRVDNNAVNEYFEVSEIRIYYKYVPLRIRD